MRMYDLILKKKQGGELSTDEIRYMIEGFTEGSMMCWISRGSRG